MDLVSFAFDVQAHYDPEKPLYISAENPSISLNASQMNTLVKQLVAGFQAAGLRKGEAVLLCVPNNCFYVALILGIIGAGGVFCGVNPAYQLDELVHIAEIASPRLVVVSKDIFPMVSRMCEMKGIPNDRIFLLEDLTVPDYPQDLLFSLDGKREVINDGNRTTGHPSDLQNHGQLPWSTLHDETVLRDTPAAYFSTSGTTGLPKLASLSHYSLIAQHRSLFENVPYEVVRLACLPFFHIFGAAWAVFCPLKYGEPVYIMPRFSLDNYTSNIFKYAITETYMAPPMVYELIQCERPLQQLLSTIKYVGIGGAPIDAESLSRFRSHLQPGATVTPVWGMTEFGPAALFRWGEHDDTGSIGRLIEGYDMKLVDSAGTLILADNQPGELLIRSPGIMTGYLGYPTHDEGDFFRTGDIAQVNEKKLHIVGRSKELIKVKGWQVAPAEIEAIILQHPDILDCAVVGILSADHVTELPRAYVVGRNGRKESVLGEEIYNLVRSRLVSYKKLAGGVTFLERIPRTPSGKVQRFKLFSL
ncbi:hypothetical protein TruAng_003788 [Truncatella angustata]|nr:hypothetical protein TruAng_003788 [Truncatella angustata]